MNDFTTSNGAKVVLRDYRHFDAVSVSTVDKEYDLAGTHTQALREFFQAEADERLGRWRWPADGGYVVYPLTEGVVAVVEEKNGTSGTFTRGQWVSSPHGEAAHDYFNAHPEPKPWHDAESGDVFLVTWPGSEREEAVVVPGAWPKAWECVTSARRIWPEVSS